MSGHQQGAGHGPISAAPWRLPIPRIEFGAHRLSLSTGMVMVPPRTAAPPPVVGQINRGVASSTVGARFRYGPPEYVV